VQRREANYITPSIEFPVVQVGLRLRLVLPKPGNFGATPSGLSVTSPQSASSTTVISIRHYPCSLFLIILPIAINYGSLYEIITS
jgi:hypothetical protein